MSKQCSRLRPLEGGLTPSLSYGGEGQGEEASFFPTVAEYWAGPGRGSRFRFFLGRFMGRGEVFRPAWSSDEVRCLGQATRDRPTVSKSINPCAISTKQRRTWTLSPTSTPFPPRISLPSTGTLNSRTHVPLADAPVTIPSKVSPIRLLSRHAAATFRIRRSTLLAASSRSVHRA